MLIPVFFCTYEFGLRCKRFGGICYFHRHDRRKLGACECIIGFWSNRATGRRVGTGAPFAPIGTGTNFSNGNFQCFRALQLVTAWEHKLLMFIWCTLWPWNRPFSNFSLFWNCKPKVGITYWNLRGRHLWALPVISAHLSYRWSVGPESCILYTNTSPPYFNPEGGSSTYLRNLGCVTQPKFTRCEDTRAESTSTMN